MNDRKNLMRTTYSIQEALAKLKHRRYLELTRKLTSFTGQLQELTTEARKMGISLAHGWFAAADRCSSRANRLLGDISYSISQVQQLAGHPQKETAKLSLVVEELNQIQEEFGSMDFDKSENTVFVITDAITLENVSLGPFKIQLELDKLSELYKDRPYRVIAIDPNPAATDSAITHPHVSAERLCEGDGSAAIRASLEQGRLSDFFTMVRSILNTYNPDSPYVALRDWDGTACYDCGYTMSSEDTYYCHYCERDYCSECSTYCRQCEETVCLGCGGQCPQCEELVCKNCIGACTECEELCCQSCLQDDVCPNCKEEMEKENEEQESENSEANQNRDPSQPQTSSTEVKLAS